jgi:hypothetical protein
MVGSVGTDWGRNHILWGWWLVEEGDRLQRLWRWRVVVLAPTSPSPIAPILFRIPQPRTSSMTLIRHTRLDHLSEACSLSFPQIEEAKLNFFRVESHTSLLGAGKQSSREKVFASHRSLQTQTKFSSHALPALGFLEVGFKVAKSQS